MKAHRIITIVEIENIVITVFDIRGQNHLQFEMPGHYNGIAFDKWYTRNLEAINRLKTTKEWSE